MSDFKLPANIRQIGSIDDGLKIYVEDYVHTYLRQYADSGGQEEKVAFLIGKYMIIDGSPYAFINGAIQGKYSEYEDNMEVFTQKSYDYAYEELDEFFDGLEIIGWMQSQPGYGVHLNPSYADYHMNNFSKPYQVMLVLDPTARQSLFYSWNESMTGIAEKEGYFVYYDQNKGMQEYMNKNRIPRKTTKEVIFSQEDDKGSKIFNLKTEENIENKLSKRNQPRIKTSPLAKEKSRSESSSNVEEYKKVSNLLVGLCAVLFITTFIMGAGLLQSDSRIGNLENSLNSISGAHNLLAEQINQLASLPVFAALPEGFVSTPVEPETSRQPQATPPPSQPNEATPAPSPSPIPTPPADSEPNENEPEDVDTTETFGQTIFNVPETYVVQPGDSLLLINRMFYGDVDMIARIMELNGLYSADMIRIGDVLQLPRY